MSEIPKTGFVMRPTQRARLCGSVRVSQSTAPSATVRTLMFLRPNPKHTRQSGKFRSPSIALGLCSRSNRWIDDMSLVVKVFYDDAPDKPRWVTAGTGRGRRMPTRTSWMPD